MANNRITTGKTSSIPGGLAAGAGVSVITTMAISVLLAALLDRGTMSWESAGYGILIMLMLSAFLGAITAYGRIRRQRLLVCLMSGMVYFGILLAVTALFFGGQYQATGVTGLLVAGGCGCAAMTHTGEGKKKRIIRKR